MVEQGLGERRALGRVGPRAQLVEQDEGARASRLDDPDDRAEVTREGRERLGDRLLVADIGEEVAPDREPAARLGRHVQTGLVHQAEQAERPQGDRLATGVRAGDHERGIAVAQSDVDRDHPSGQPGVTGR